MFCSQWVYCDQIKIRKEMKNKRYWKGKWDSRTNNWANYFYLNYFSYCKEGSVRRTRLLKNPLWYRVFFMLFPLPKQAKNPHLTVSFFPFSSWLAVTVLHFPTVTIPSQMASSSQGGSGREQACQACLPVPASCMHADWQADLILPSVASLFFLTSIPSPGSAFHK